MDKHGVAALLIGKPMGPSKGPGGGSESEEEEKDEKLSYSALAAHQLNAMHEYMKASKNDDAEAALEAWCTMHELEHAKIDKEAEGDTGEEPEEEEVEEEEPEEAAE